MPNNSVVSTQGNTRLITGGTRAGSNLFHSFKEFSVLTGSAAYFNNAADIQNIISRVTGASVSNIDGLIRANGTANVFLINPHGIVFGPSSSLNVGGSFVATTANAIQFANQGFFSADNPDNPALLTVNPTALLFNQIAAASIQNNSVAPAGLDLTGLDTFGLRVPDGKSLLLVGGNISMDGGRLNAFGGRVELGGLAGTGTVGLNVDGMLSLSFPNGVEPADVSLNNKSVINVRAASGGSININARNLDITGSQLLAGIGQMGTPTSQAGDITLNATSAIRINQQSRIENNVQSGATGNSGNINITASSLWMTGNAVLNTSTSGLGAGGDVIINTEKFVKLDGEKTAVQTNVETGGRGKGGDIYITTPTLSLTNGGNLYAATKAKGDAGNIIINAGDRVNFDGGSYASTNVEGGSTGGKGGDIRITTPTLSLTNVGQLFADTSGNGNAGSVIINADTVHLDGRTSREKGSGIFSRVLGGGMGKGGDIRITTGSLSVTNGAGLFAFINGQGDGGSVIINARDFVSLDGVGGDKITSGVFTQVNNNGSGNGANVSITTGSLSLSNKAQLITGTDGQGDAGNVIVNANKRVSLDSQSRIITNANQNSTRKGGDIFITTKDFSLANGAIVNASTASTQNVGGRSGDITVETNTLRILNGAELVAGTASRPNAGNITINSKTLTIDNGKIAVNSQETGEAGNIKILSNNLTLKNQAQISAETLSSQGGNIEINLKDILVLRQGSKISTNAGIAQKNGNDGNGGDITINAPQGLIVAIPKEDSDITANAYQGRGGNINIKTSGLFGIQPRQQDIPNSSDITASSKFGVNGTVQINTPDVDATRETVQLPTNLVDASQMLDTSCNPGSRPRASSFVVNGRGGLPPNPKTEPLSSDAVQVDWVTLKPSNHTHTTPSVTSTTTTTPEPIVEATGWVKNEFGEVFLTANPPITPLGSRFNPTCHSYD